MNLLTKVSVGLLLLAAAFVGGYVYRGKTAIPISSVPKTETKQETVVTERVIIRRTEPATGVATETVTEKVTETAHSTSHTPTPALQPKKPEWSVGIYTKYSPEHNEWRPSSADIGYRVLGDLWGTLGIDFKDNSVGLGLRFQF